MPPKKEKGVKITSRSSDKEIDSEVRRLIQGDDHLELDKLLSKLSFAGDVLNGALQTATLELSIMHRESYRVLLKHGVNYGIMLPRYMHERGVLIQLLDDHADINFRDISGATVLHHAARTSIPSSTWDLFIQYGGDLTVKDGRGNTPLLCACFYSVENVNVLLGYGADPFATNIAGESTLHALCHYVLPMQREAMSLEAKLAAIRALCERGIFIDSVDNAKNTSLKYAMISGLPTESLLHIIDIFEEFGADPSIADEFGNTPPNLLPHNQKIQDRFNHYCAGTMYCLK